MSSATFPKPPAGLDAETYARAAAPLVGLPLPEDAVPEVAVNLLRAAGFAALLDGAPDIGEIDSVPVPSSRGSAR